MMTSEQLTSKLSELIHLWEQETIEFKEANDNFSTNDIGKYFSALANEANLRGATEAWLVFGVNNKTRKVVGTTYRENAESLNKLKHEISSNSSPIHTFKNIHTLDHKDGRVILFEIPPAPRGIPIAWKSHCYARNGESLGALSFTKSDAIRSQTKTTDWTAEEAPEATIEDIDPLALKTARKAFTLKYANRFPSDEVANWSDEVFLERIKLTIKGRITNACLLLLGKETSASLLLPNPAQMTWKLEGLEERAYQHFSPPFLLASTLLYQKIRNVQIRILPDDALLPVEVAKYDQKIILEALHNCIAHQDYTKNARVIVTEYPQTLLLESKGSFFDGKPEDYLKGEKTPSSYRNPFLTQAMVELSMIDTMGYGIRDMHMGQRNRYLPLPDYDLTESDTVKLTIYGKIIDEAYSRLLIEQTDLTLDEILGLDRVQKKLSLSEDSIKLLRSRKLLEGKPPNFHVSATVAEATDQKVKYIHDKGLDDEHYKQLIIQYLKDFGSASRQDIETLVLHKLGDVLNEEQKNTKVSNLINNLRRAEIIENKGARKTPKWVLNKSG